MTVFSSICIDKNWGLRHQTPIFIQTSTFILSIFTLLFRIILLEISLFLRRISSKDFSFSGEDPSSEDLFSSSKDFFFSGDYPSLEDFSSSPYSSSEDSLSYSEDPSSGDSLSSSSGDSFSHSSSSSEDSSSGYSLSSSSEDSLLMEIPLNLQGKGLAPEASFDVTSINVGLMNLDSIFEYKVNFVNIGQVGCEFELKPRELESISVEFTPQRGSIYIGGSVPIRVKFISSKVSLSRFTDVLEKCRRFFYTEELLDQRFHRASGDLILEK